MLSYTIKDAKKLFFDRAVVIAALEKRNRKALAIIGFKIRREARRLLRPAKPEDPPGPPGHPPRSRVGYLRKFIFFAYDPGRKSVIVGPALFAGGEQNPTVPELHEYGGVAGRAVADVRWTTQNGRRVRTVVSRRPIIARYPARPYMRPAFEHIAPQIPDVWREILNR